MVTPTQAGILAFALAVMAGPLYAVSEYSAVSNLISELGAQHTQNNFIMIAAFAVLGGGIILDGLKRFHVSLLPFILYGSCMAVVGLFPHKPINPHLDFNATVHDLHGIIAGIAGTFITVGFVWQGLRAGGGHRIICFYMGGVALVFPVLILRFPNYQGIIQRVMYVQVLGWLWARYPAGLVNPAVRRTLPDRAADR